MKIAINLEELKHGKQTKRWGEKRRSAIADEIANRRPIGLTGGGTIIDGRRINLVFPVALEANEDKRHTLQFKPVWCRAMTGCHIRSQDIRVLVVKFDHGQFEFSPDGEKPSRATMEGPGCDPVDVAESETALADLLLKYPGNGAVKHCRAHIAERFGQSK